MSIIFQIAFGGAIGAALRHLVGWQITRVFGTGFPWGTMTINVLGSFLMGVAAMIIIRRTDLQLQHFAPFLMTGVLGGFTTFSAFSLEAFLLVERGRWDLALLYMGGSVVLGFLGFVVAVLVVRGWAGA